MILSSHIRKEITVLVLFTALSMTLVFWHVAYKQEKLDAYASMVVGTYSIDDL
jgi:hypothetical protein